MAKMRDEATQARHRLTHLPYATCCKARIEHRAHPHRHQRTYGLKRGSVREVSFDFCYTRARGSEEQYAGWLQLTAKLGSAVPLGSKGKFRLIAQESIFGAFRNHLQE